MTIALSVPSTGGGLLLDEHVDEACFVLAMALRRILDIEPLDATNDEDEDDELEKSEEDSYDFVDTYIHPGN